MDAEIAGWVPSKIRWELSHRFLFFQPSYPSLLSDELVYRYGLYVYSFIGAMRTATDLAVPAARDVQPTSVTLRFPGMEP
jgi:hypothetical protein